MAPEESITRPLVSIASLIIHVHGCCIFCLPTSGLGSTKGTYCSSPSRGSASSIGSGSKFLTIPSIYPYYRLRGRTPTDQASSAPSVATGSSVRSNTIDEYPPEIQALPVIPSFSGSALVVGTMPPASSCTLPVVRIFGSGSYAEHVDAASMLPSAPLVPTSTVDPHPTETQAPTPSQGEGAPAADATTPCIPCTPPVVCMFGGGTHAEHVDAASMLPSAPLVPTSTVDPRPTETRAPTPSQGEGAPAADATTPCIPCTPPAVRISGGGTHAEHIDAASMLSSAPPVPTSTVDVRPSETQAPTPSQGEGAPVADAMTPYTPCTLPVPAITIHFPSHHHANMSSLPSSASWIHEFAQSNGYAHAIGQPLDNQPMPAWLVTSFSPAVPFPVHTGRRLIIQSSTETHIYFGSIKSVIRLDQRHIILHVVPLQSAYGEFLPPSCTVFIPRSLIQLSKFRQLQYSLLSSRLPDNLHELLDSIQPVRSPIHSIQQRQDESPSPITFLNLSSTPSL
ncbi:hypothetical protein BU15DRAFT_80404 [Melanogaster broomeanus]|nr:hypothetical protein BU15DRAFT_80404 [Melanogaster broomeanus]